MKDIYGDKIKVSAEEAYDDWLGQRWEGDIELVIQDNTLFVCSALTPKKARKLAKKLKKAALQAERLGE